MVNLRALAFSTLAGAGLAGTLSAAFADTGLGRVGTGVTSMCSQLMCILPVVSMLMLIGAAVVYAAGQLMGAETRARATTWATAMLIGALIGILIVTVAPPIISTIYAGDTTSIGASLCTCSG